MAAERNASNSHSSASHRIPTSQAMSPSNQINNPFDSDLGLSSLTIGTDRGSGRLEMDTTSAIRMRKLPRSTTHDGLRTMLLFAKDFVSADFVPSDSEDQSYLTAIARFRSTEAAQEAQSLLHGKQNGASETPMVVEILRLSPNGVGPRRNQFDLSAPRADSSSSNHSSGGPARQTTRYANAFQSRDRISPQNFNGKDSADILSPRSHFASSQSPVNQRISGKDVIGEDEADDEPSEILRDPLRYANGEISSPPHHRPTSEGMPSRYGPLSLSTNGNNPSQSNGFTSPRTVGGRLQSPTGPMSPTSMHGMGMGMNGNFHMGHHITRHTYPPVNPADQNPPCNTLYVGNLPIDTSEDELKSMFSKQRGYKRLCFRTKQNGPMCFVEFEDISFATKALNELYGHPLHNSVKGGIRLSFSKNPLGVRTGQPSGIGPASPMSPTGSGPPIMNGLGSFSTASGPPPGLAAPPGLINQPLGIHPQQGSSGHMMGLNGLISPTTMGYNMGDMGVGMNGPQSPPGSWAGQDGNVYNDYVYGR